jgi:hypothetical protein
LPLAVKLVALGELAFIELDKASSHTGMDERSSGFDDDGDLIAVAVAEPVKWDGTNPAEPS